MNKLEKFFHPDSIAVIGASEVLGSFGTRYIQALHDFGYKGKIYPVNRNGNAVLGHTIHRSVLDIPDTIDLACICVSARFVPDILKDCLKKGIKAATILSSGFRESGEEGRLIEEEIARLARQGISVMGPNCFGTYCPDGKITVIPGGSFSKERGGTALIVQSGQLSEMIVARSFGEGIRYSKSASFGNACDINEADLLEYFMEDEQTKVISAYLEGVREGSRFLKIARTNAGRKPLLVWKAGLSQIGASAAASHTGSLAGQRAVWDAFFQQTGAIRVNNLDDLIDTMVGFSCLPNGCGRKVALMSGGGAGAVFGADICEDSGMIMRDFNATTISQLQEVLPSIGTSLHNPLDMGNPHPPLQVLRSILEIVAADDAIDVIVIRRVFFSVKTARILAGTVAASEEEQEELLQIPVDVMKKFGKPVVIVMPEELTGVADIDLEEDRRRIRDYFFSHGIPTYLSEQRAFTALAHLASYRDLRLGGKEATDIRLIEKPSKGRAVLSELIAQSSYVKMPTPILDELASKKVMAEYGIDVTEPILVQSKEAAVAAAERIGLPVVAKIVSPQITHKTDMNGVRLGLSSRDEVYQGYSEIMDAARVLAPQAVISGISIQKMAPPGLELVIGMNRDPQFGPVVMFGLGGIFVEVLKDVAFRIAPLSRQDAKDMIKEIRAYPVLEGYRGQPAVDVGYIEDLLLTIGRIGEDNPEIKEIDINPLIAHGKGAMAVDGRIVLDDSVITPIKG
jgi:acetate---CoA ligase (ADP-forming)